MGHAFFKPESFREGLFFRKKMRIFAKLLSYKENIPFIFVIAEINNFLHLQHAPRQLFLFIIIILLLPQNKLMLR